MDSEIKRIIVGSRNAPSVGLSVDLPDDRVVWVAMDGDAVFLKFKNKSQYTEISLSHEATMHLVNLIAQVTDSGYKLRANYGKNAVT